jgi:hypothetical protein
MILGANNPFEDACLCGDGQIETEIEEE